MTETIEVQLSPDKLDFGYFSITNTMFSSIILSIILVILVWFLTRKFGAKPTKFQVAAEYIFMLGYDFTKKTLGDEKITKKVYPIVATIFVVILFFNLAKFIPGFESIMYGDKHLFRAVHTDMNMTLSLAIIAWLIVQFLGFYILGIKKYAGKFIHFIKIKGIPVFINPLGLLEAVSEVSKIFSLSLRLFLNILVGMVLVTFIHNISKYFAPLIMMLFEVFVAFLQAGVFALLFILYIRMAITAHEHDEAEHKKIEEKNSQEKKA